MNKHFSTPNFSHDSNGHYAPKDEPTIANQDEAESSFSEQTFVSLSPQEIPFLRLKKLLDNGIPLVVGALPVCGLKQLSSLLLLVLYLY